MVKEAPPPPPEKEPINLDIKAKLLDNFYRDVGQELSGKADAISSASLREFSPEEVKEYLDSGYRLRKIITDQLLINLVGYFRESFRLRMTEDETRALKYYEDRISPISQNAVIDYLGRDSAVYMGYTSLSRMKADILLAVMFRRNENHIPDEETAKEIEQTFLESLALLMVQIEMEIPSELMIRLDADSRERVEKEKKDVLGTSEDARSAVEELAKIFTESVEGAGKAVEEAGADPAFVERAKQTKADLIFDRLDSIVLHSSDEQATLRRMLGRLLKTHKDPVDILYLLLGDGYNKFFEPKEV